MEYIAVKDKDGQLKYHLGSSDSVMVTSAKQVRSVMEEDYVDIELLSVDVPSIQIGDNIKVYGRVYTVNQLPTIEKTGSRSHKINVRFEGVHYSMARASFMMTVDTTTNDMQDIMGNSLIGDIRIFLDVLVANLNRVFPNKWVVGVYPSNTPSDTLISFEEGATCLSVLQTLCDVFDSEFDINTDNNGLNTINIRELQDVFPYTLSYGKYNGLYELKRSNSDCDNMINKLYVYGSTKNITQNYQCDRLVLNGTTKSTSFIKDDTLIAQYGIFEGLKIFDDIYPHREGTVTGIDTSNRLKLTDSSMFDLLEKWLDTTSDYQWWLELKGLDNTANNHATYRNEVAGNTKYLMPGTNATLHFNSGKLAGYDFGISSYDHSTHTFILKRMTDERGLKLPNDEDSSFQISVGDKYTLTDIMLPASYIMSAQQRLYAAAQEYYSKVCTPRVKYELKIDENYIKRNVQDEEIAIFPGDYITLTDTSFVSSDTNIRVRRVERNIFSQYEYLLELDDVNMFRERRRKVTIDNVNQLNDISKYTIKPYEEGNNTINPNPGSDQGGTVQ